MSNANVIPNAVSGLGPAFQRLPVNLVVEIFKIALVIDNILPYEDDIETKKIMTKALTIGFNAVAIVSRSFQAMANELFYDANKFEFLCTGEYRKASRHRTVMPPDMPHWSVRHLLRHVHVEFVFEDGYLAGYPDGYNGTIGLQAPRVPITTVTGLMTYCPSAFWFATLTHATIGFRNLDTLEIDIIVDVRGSQQTALQIFQAANFSVRANTVIINIKNRHGVTEAWHSGLDQAIARV